MGGLNKRTTRLLALLAVVFIIVLVIICLVPPSGGPSHAHQAGKSSGTVPEGIITDTPETTETSTSTSTRVPDSTSTISESTSEESSTSASTTPFYDDETTFYDRDSSDTEVEEPTQEDLETTETTTDLWFSGTTTSTSETSASTTETTIIESSTNGTDHIETSTSNDGLSSTDTETEESTSTTEEETTTVKSTTHHYDEVHNETSTEIYTLFDETTTDNFTETPESTTDLEEISTTTTSREEEVSTTTTEVVETTEILTDIVETTSQTSSQMTTTEAETTEATTTSTTSTHIHFESLESTDVCTHPDCKELAARMLDMMDHRADPCKDFYQYACGGVEDDPFLHPEDPSLQVYNRLLEMLRATGDPDEYSFSLARQFYTTCINRPLTPTPEVAAKLREMVDKYGLLDPRVLGNDTVLATLYDYISEDTFKLEEMIADFIKLDYALFFDVGVDVDKRDNRNLVVRLSLPLDGFNSGLSESIDTTVCVAQHQQVMEDAIKSKTQLDLNAEYEKLKECRTTGQGLAHQVVRLQEAARALNLTQHVTDPDHARRLIGETAFNSEEFLTAIKESWPEPSEIRHSIINKNFTEYTTEQLDNEDILGKLVNWGNLLKAVVGRPVSKVQVYHVDDVRSVMKNVEEIANKRAAELRNMLLMLWGARLYTDVLAPEGRGAPGTSEYCVTATQYLMPDIAAEMFLKSFSVLELEAMGEQVTRVVNSVKKTVSAGLQNKPGVSAELRYKLQRTFTQVGAAQYLQELSDDVEKSTENLILEDDYADNVLELLKRRRALLYSLVGDSAAHHTALWNHFSVPYSISATTLYSANSILIPEGVMTPPFLYPHLAHLPDYITFAGIGHVVAHEFLHAIDTTGIKFDGLIGDKLSRPPAMDAREYCFSKLLNSSSFILQVRNSTTVTFMLPEGLHLNEQMVDSEATRLAWLAYVHGNTADGGSPLEVVTDRPMRRRRSTVSTTSPELPLPWLGLSPHQLFLLRTAQTQCSRTSDQDVIGIMEREHLPARLRVNLALALEPLFAQAFKCPLGSKMAVKYTCPYIIGHVPQHGTDTLDTLTHT